MGMGTLLKESCKSLPKNAPMIKINFTDFWKGFDKNDNYFANILRTFCQFEISDSPDFLFYSVNGYDFLKYNCVRIFFTGENITPNFNQCDYAMGFDRLTFEDRYLRLPLYFLYQNALDNCLENRKFEESDLVDRKFCNFIYSRNNPAPERARFFNLLSEYKFIHSGGKFLNNIGYCVDNKLEFQKQFKFSIAFENSSTPGYTTEKIVEAKASGTIPVYWGNPFVHEECNPGAFVNCHDFGSFKETVERISELDNHNEAFCSILNEPLFSKDFIDSEKQKQISFLRHIVEKGKINRRADSVLKQKEEKKLRLVAVTDRARYFLLPLSVRKRIAGILERISGKRNS